MFLFKKKKESVTHSQLTNEVILHSTGMVTNWKKKKNKGSFHIVTNLQFKNPVINFNARV